MFVGVLVFVFLICTCVLIDNSSWPLRYQGCKKMIEKSKHETDEIWPLNFCLLVVGIVFIVCVLATILLLIILISVIHNSPLNRQPTVVVSSKRK